MRHFYDVGCFCCCCFTWPDQRFFNHYFSMSPFILQWAVARFTVRALTYMVVSTQTIADNSWHFPFNLFLPARSLVDFFPLSSVLLSGRRWLPDAFCFFIAFVVRQVPQIWEGIFYPQMFFALHSLPAVLPQPAFIKASPVLPRSVTYGSRPSVCLNHKRILQKRISR